MKAIYRESDSSMMVGWMLLYVVGVILVGAIVVILVF